MYNILIVDDNPFPTRETISVILERMSIHMCCSFDKNKNLFNKKYGDDYNSLVDGYHNVRGKCFIFTISDKMRVIVYNYNPKYAEEYNQNKICRIIGLYGINVLWIDRGHSDFRLENGGMYEVECEHNTKSDIIFENELIVNALNNNKIKQLAVYTYNPKLSIEEIIKRRDVLFEQFSMGNKQEDIVLKKEDIYVLETSAVFNMYNAEDYLADGTRGDKYLGSINAYKYYGKLLGNILFDLFLQLKEQKKKLSKIDARYNYFNGYNRSFIVYFKFLNSGNFIFKTEDDQEFKIGLTSFYGEAYGDKYFLLDVPYKEYYKAYDTLLQEGPDKISSIFDFKTNEKDDLIKIIYYKYRKVNCDYEYDFVFNCELKENDERIQRFLPLLHTAIFYEPEFYSDKHSYPFDAFKRKGGLCSDCNNENECIEIYYSFKKIKLKNINGIVHFAVWRRSSRKGIYRETGIMSMMNSYYKIVEPKIHESLINIYQHENLKKSIKAAISQVMARNMSHNIGSHVMNKLVTGVKNIDWKKTKYTSLINNDLTVKLTKAKDKHEIIIDQLTCFNNYIRSRMDYLADIALGTPVMQYGRSVKDVMLEFDKVRLLLEYISGLSDFKYEIVYNDTINYVVAMPNNVLGCQALYNIIENIIRNTAKHGGATETVRFEINIREISDPDLKQKYGDDLYEVTVCDSVPAKDEELADKQNEKINGKIIGDDYKLRHGSLGMAEMKSSAAYLRKISLSLIDSEDIDPPLLAAFLDDNKHLVYRFYLRKPKMVMYVKNNISGQTLNDKLKTNGVELLSSVDFKNKLCNGAIFDHNFIVYDDDEIVELIKMDEYRSSLPVRCYKKEAIDINEINALADDYEVLHKDIWDKWLEINVIDKNYKVSNVLPTDITKNADGSLTQTNKLCIENHKEHLVIVNLTTLIKSGIQIDDLHNHKIFSETINSLGIRQLPYYEHIPELIPTSKISEAPDCVKKINEDDVERYRVFFNKNYDYYVSNIDNLKTLRAKYADLCLWQLSEAAVTRILVIDERIQEYAKSEMNYRTLMLLVNINIPDKNINLSDNDIKSQRRFIMGWINTELDKRTQFMVLHYGILERLVGDDKSEIDTILNAWAAKCTVVVTSGRGSYFVLPSSVRFMNLSNIHNAFIDIKNKYYITAVLHASRKKENTDE